MFQQMSVFPFSDGLWLHWQNIYSSIAVMLLAWIDVARIEHCSLLFSTQWVLRLIEYAASNTNKFYNK